MVATMLAFLNFKFEEKTTEETSKLLTSLGSSPPKLKEGSLCEIFLCLLGISGYLLGSEFGFWIGLVGTAREGHWAMEFVNLIGICLIFSKEFYREKEAELTRSFRDKWNVKEETI